MIQAAFLVAIALGALQAQDPAEAARQRQARINDLRKQIESSDENTRLKAIQDLGTIVHEDSRSLLISKTVSDSDKVRLAAGKALIAHKKPVCAQALGNAVQANAKNEKMVKSFIGLLAELDMCAAVPVLLNVLRTHASSGPDALEALAKIGCPEAVTDLVAYLKLAETEEKKPDYFDNVDIRNGQQQPRRPGTPEKIENKTKDKKLAALAPKVREALKALSGKSFDSQREWASALQSGSLTPRLVSVYLCESTHATFETAPGKSKKCPNGGDAKSDHDDTFLKHHRE